MARVKVIRENWNLKYSAVFILCPIRGNSAEIPYSVSVVSKIRAPPGNVLLLRNTDNDPDFVNHSVANIPNEMAVCVKPLHFNYDQSLYLLEFLELNNLLGMSHFTFYNHTIGPKTTCILKHYMNGDIPFPTAQEATETVETNEHENDVNSFPSKQNNNNNNYYNDNTIQQKSNKITVNILPWNLRMRSQKEIRTEGLFASLNDCLYRSMYR